MTSPTTSVLIVGAGPNGLALACLLARLDVPFRIVEKKEGRSRTSKAIGLQYRVSELLAQMGVVDRFLAAGGTPTPVNMYEGGRRLVRMPFDLGTNLAGRDAFSPTPILLPQSETERLLAERLRELGHEVEWNTELVSFEEDDGGVRTVLRRGAKEEQADSIYLVSCEGAHSRIRALAGIGFAGKTYPLTFVLADVPIDWRMARTENHVWFHRDGALAALPLPQDGLWRLFFEVARGAAHPDDTPTLGEVQALFAARTGLANVSIGNPKWTSVFRLHCRMVDRYRSGRVFLAGDAAHIHSPTGGQGITTGLQDVANLAWKLGRVLNGAPDALLDTYQQERLPEAQAVLRETDRTTTLFFSKNPLTRLMRDAVVLPILRAPAVQRRMFHKLAQLHVSYRRSALSVDDIARRRTRGLRAGDRAPDVAFVDNRTGDRVTLFNLLSGYRPLLLLGTPANGGVGRDVEALVRRAPALDIGCVFVTLSGADMPGEWRSLGDIHGDFRKFYGVAGDFACLVRPDGHVGLLQMPADARRLSDYMRAFCDPRTIDILPEQAHR